jgi:tRNA threonylcarbamoyl adenosine modification protein YeaZ
MSANRLILGMESAVAGGSLSLLQDETELAVWEGHGGPLRAEDILIRIQDVLLQARVKASDLTGIAVSAGPGSFTGIRVGLATALGLAGSLGIPVSSCSVLEAMASSLKLTGVAAIPMGRGAAAAQHFVNGRAIDKPFNVSTDHLFAADAEMFLLHLELGTPSPEESSDIMIFRTRLATAIARMSFRHPSISTPPIFLSRATEP